MNLFQFTPCRMAKPRTGAPQVVRKQNVNARELCVSANDPPDYVLTDAITPNVAGLTDAAEDESRLDTSAGDPGVDGQFHPGGHGDSANVTALADQIDDCPVLVSLLKMGYAQPSEF